MPKSKHRKTSKPTAQKTQKKQSWKEFEELVARIEAALAPRDAIIKSPDRLLDSITGEFREVDASIRYKVGTVEILIIIECRERSKVEDSRWIEQLALKQRDLGAAKCIAVSSTGFSKPAAKKAKSLGIEIRKIKRISEDAILEWAPFRTWFYNYELLMVDLSFEHDGIVELNQERDNELNAELASRYKLEDKILYSKTGGATVSIREFVEHMLNRFYGETPDVDSVRRMFQRKDPYIISFFGEPQFYVNSERGRVDMMGVAIKIRFRSFKDFAVVRTAAFTYADGDKDLVEGHEFEFTIGGDNKERIAIHKDLFTDLSRISSWKI